MTSHPCVTGVPRAPLSPGKGGDRTPRPRQPGVNDGHLPACGAGMQASSYLVECYAFVGEGCQQLRFRVFMPEFTTEFPSELRDAPLDRPLRIRSRGSSRLTALPEGTFLRKTGPLGVNEDREHAQSLRHQEEVEDRGGTPIDGD